MIFYIGGRQGVGDEVQCFINGFTIAVAFDVGNNAAVIYRVINRKLMLVTAKDNAALFGGNSTITAAFALVDA